jgi:hypothetical protein
MAKMGRPKIEIDLEKVSLLAKNGYTLEDIAMELEVDVKTLKTDKDFSKTYKKAVNSLKSWTRMKLYENAKNGCTTSLIFLSKTLGISDKVSENDLKREEFDFRKKIELKKLELREKEVGVMENMKVEFVNFKKGDEE